VPGIYKYFDVPDIAGLIAPRPLLIEMGVQDTGFFIEEQLMAYDKAHLRRRWRWRGPVVGHASRGACVCQQQGA
jgi:hypothetical protein